MEMTTVEVLRADWQVDPEVEQAGTVLVVDDDDQLRLLTAACLQNSGFRVVEAADASCALAVFQEENPDLVLCDVVMPGMDGFELCGALRALPGGAHLPIVMMTGLDDMESVERAYAVGATEFCVKPLNWVLLPRHVRFILKAGRTQEKLRASQERYALAARGASDALWDWDIKAGSVYFSPRWWELLGERDGAAGDHVDDWLDRIHVEDGSRVRAELNAHLDGRQERFESEHRVRCASGRHIWVLVRGVAVRDGCGKPTRMAGSLTDISDRKEAQQRLEHNALHDSLTDLPNRALFMDRLEHCLRRAIRHQDERFAVLFIDLDRFKVINDSLGHLIGDRLLIEVGRRLSAQLRTGETLARLGGDEFAVLVEDYGDDSTPENVAERIHTALRQPADIEGHSVVTSASIGITANRADYEHAEEMLRDADVAMYAAKARGPGHSECFRPAMHVKAVRSLELERELRVALERNEITVHYQPIMALDGNRISSFEALVRWNHPRDGLLLPSAFLDIAIDSGLIIPIGRIVLESACRQLQKWEATWPEAGTWSMCVNLCAQELLDPELIGFVDATIERTGMDPRRLKLEITERSLIGNLEQARKVMLALRERGIRMAVDDFGTGFSSFSYLQRLPFDVLKIDRSFIRAFEQNSEGAQIIQAMIKVGHELGLEIVAEGSENASSIDCLRTLHCEYAQGNLLAPAMPVSSIEAMLNETCGESTLAARGADHDQPA